MMAQRLFIDSITSIGVVEEGDNPLSKILLFKAKGMSKDEALGILRSMRIRRQKANPALSTKDIEGEILRERPDLAKALGRKPETAKAAGMRIAKALDARFKQQAKQMAATSDGYAEIGKQIRAIKGDRMAEQRTVKEIEAEVTSRASTITKSAGATLKMPDARVEVWRADPELKVEMRKAKVAEVKAQQTSVDDIDRIVKSYSLSISAEPENMAKTLGQIKTEVMGSAIGLEIKNLRRALRGGTVPEIEIAKSVQFSSAWATLKKWDSEG